MPTLKNIRHERFAQNVVSGLSLSAAYIAAGYKEAGASANGARLMATEAVASRVDELQKLASERTVEKIAIDQVWVLDKLRENVERAMQITSAKDEEGNVIGEFRWNGTVANRALELIGKHIGMFRDGIDMTVNGQFDVQQKAITLAKVMTIEELEALQAKLIAASQDQQQRPQVGRTLENLTVSGQLLPAPAESPSEQAARNGVAAEEAESPQKRPRRSWRDKW